MQVNRVNNQQPSFGMKYVNPREWDPKVLKTLMDSKLVQEIDAKYPKAYAVWESNFDYDIFDYMSLTITLVKDKVIEFFERDELDKNFDSSCHDCMQKIRNSSLEDLEQMYAQEQRNIQEIAAEEEEEERVYARAEALNAEGRTPFQRFICKIFGIK